MICPGECGFQTQSIASFTTHLSKIRICTICQQEFHGRYGSRNYIKHQKDHKKPNKIQARTCPYCGILFKYRCGFVKHQKSRCYQTQGRDSANSLSKSKALGATRSDNVDLWTCEKKRKKVVDDDIVSKYE